MAEAFDVELIPIINGYLVQRDGLTWHFDSVKPAIEKIESLITEWHQKLGLMRGEL